MIFWTTRLFLFRERIRSYVAVFKPYLTARHVSTQLNRAKLYQQCTEKVCANVTFSYESSFTVWPTALRKKLCRKVGNLYRTCNLFPTIKSRYVTLSAWTAFSSGRGVPSVRINGSLNKHKYREIIKANLLPFASTYYGRLTDFCISRTDAAPPPELGIFYKGVY